MQPQIIIHDDSRITPFWLRLPKFFLFPLRAHMLFVLVPLALASLLVPVFPARAPFDLLVVEALIWLAALRHAFNVTERTSQGLLTAAEQARGEADPERVNLPWKLLGVVVFWGMLIGALALLSRVLATLANLFFVLAFPASVMALSASNSLRHSLNPLLWLSIMRTVGKPYLALFFFLFLLSGGSAIALPMLSPFLRGWFALPLANFVFLYFNLIMFNMIGYALYQYHRELGLDVKVGFAEQQGRAAERGDRRAAPADPIGDEVAARVAAGDLEGALDTAYEQQRMEPDNLIAHERYHKLLQLSEKRQRTLDHGQRYLAALLRRERDDQAFDLFNRLRELDEGFLPEQPGHLLNLAQAAYRRREPELALSLINGFDKRNARHPDIPAVYMLAARILAEHYRRDDMAGAILRGLREKYPQHPLAAEAESFQRALDSLRVKPA
jgi:hypothetical protein